MRRGAQALGPLELRFRELFLVACNRPLEVHEEQALEALLPLGESGPEQSAIVIAPRLGTVSPWCSKATDIAQRCGLGAVDRVERAIAVSFEKPAELAFRQRIAHALYDPLLEGVFDNAELAANLLFSTPEPRELQIISRKQLGVANRSLGLALSSAELRFLEQHFDEIDRDPTDVELMMFAQVNSEHCRHKIFKSAWLIDGRREIKSLFALIQNTHRVHPDGTLSAYSDNAAVFAGVPARPFFVAPGVTRYQAIDERAPFSAKVETHNHPTGISPHPGAGTGSGGEIRDESATGRGARPKAGFSGFITSHLRIPNTPRPWENEPLATARLATPLNIMLEGPLGAADYNNEFGRPAIAGFFRTFEQVDSEDHNDRRGFHKPIMLAGGIGHVRPQLVEKQTLEAGDLIVVLGGPAMLIGVGGGAASSQVSGASSEDLDFASVQRANPEMQRRCQEVINRCWAQGADNPIVTIHDVGAGGLSNAVPEILDDSELGGEIDLDAVPTADVSMSPMEIWCNEAQERYVLGIRPARLDDFRRLCERERAPFAVIGEASAERVLRVRSQGASLPPVEMAMQTLFAEPPRMVREDSRRQKQPTPFETDGIDFRQAVERVLRFPAVASKKFLITIGDRTVGGLCARDSMVGPWQLPVADAVVVLDDFDGYSGQAMALGERPPLSLIDPKAAARMAVTEAVTNLCSAPVRIDRIRLSANWMAAANQPGEGAALFDAVAALGEEFCPAVGLAIPVGKDSLSMRTQWQIDGTQHTISAPLSAIISAFAPVHDVRSAKTPLLDSLDDTELVLLDLAAGETRLGASILAQCWQAIGNEAPDIKAPVLRAFLESMTCLHEQGLVLAYHDRSDGGLLTSLLEMAFASRCGLAIDVPSSDPLAFFFNEEPGVVLQIQRGERARVEKVLSQNDLGDALVPLGVPVSDERIRLSASGSLLLDDTRVDLERLWGETSYAMQRLRDNPQCADEEWEVIGEQGTLASDLRFDLSERRTQRFRLPTPEVGILREQGVNGQVEMAAAFERAGFAAIDVHMNDLHAGLTLDRFCGIVIGGGFSFGDVLGAGRGWAQSILLDPRLREAFADFFADSARFALGVCNGCQVMSELRALIPGSDAWPHFVRNRSGRFESRLSSVEILPSPSLFFEGMQGSRIPVAVAHGEGRTTAVEGRQPVATMRFVNFAGDATERYPHNPNGSSGGLTGFCNTDGRISILMPHPERVFRSVQFSWAPNEWPDLSPWQRMFDNARFWIDR